MTCWVVSRALFEIQEELCDFERVGVFGTGN
jgi:hypothetical protein